MTSVQPTPQGTVQFDPENELHWINVLHNAASTPKGSPDYGEARSVIGLALRHINALHVKAYMDEQNQKPGAAASILGGLAHGASLGTGEVIAGLGTAAQGKGFREGAQQYREGLGELEAAHPYLTTTPVVGAETLGSLALPAAAVGNTLKAVKAGVPLGIRGALGIAGRGALAGAIPGAVAGFSGGGEDPGDFGARLKGAAKGAAIGGALGAITSSAAIPHVRAHVERTADIANQGVMRELNAQRLRNAQSVGARYAKQPAPPSHVACDPISDIEQALADDKAGRISREDLNTAMQVAGDAPRAQQIPVRGEVRAGFPPERPIPDIEIPEPAIQSGPAGPRPTPDPLDTPTFQRRAQDAEVMQRALQRNPWSTKQMPGGKPLRSARTQQVTQAAEQIANLTDEQLQQAKRLTGGNRQLVNLINRELKRRAGQ